MNRDQFKEWYETKWLNRDKNADKHITKNHILKNHAAQLAEKKLYALNGRDFLDQIKQRNIEKIKNAVANPPMSEHDKVVKILKKDFEAKHGMTFDRFIELYNDILKNTPERLI